MKNTHLQWLASIMVLGIFAWMAIASLGPLDLGEAEPKKLVDISYHEYSERPKYQEITFNTVFTGDSIIEEKRGFRDDEGRWHDSIQIIRQVFDSKYPHQPPRHKEVEKGVYVNGMRHGKFTREFYEDGKWIRSIEMTFHMGELIITRPTYGKLSKNDLSAFSLLNDRYLWFLYAFHYMDIGDELVEPYMNALEDEIRLEGFDPLEWNDEQLWFFDEAYDMAIDALSEYENYEKLINYHNLITAEEAMDIIRGNEFRLAVLDRYYSGANSTYEVLATKYPGYTDLMFQAETEEGLFETFCGLFDTQMDGLEPLDQEDPFFVDSLDQRMAVTLFAIMFSDKSIFDLYREARELALAGKYFKYHKLTAKFRKMALKDDIEMRPEDFGFIVFYRFMLDFQKGDLVRRAIRDKFFKNCVKPALVTTYIPDGISGSALSIAGFVIEDGGADVTERGIVWGNIYNPTKDENVILSGSGKGEFTVSLSDLEEGKTYYARAYAINSLGISYGNVVQFMGTGGTTSIPVYENMIDFFRVFPVPAKDLLRVNLENSGTATIKLINMNGQVVRDHIVKETSEKEIIISTEGLPSGFYIVRINYAGQSATKKVVIE
jgi:hypothetical protein